jgi:hypothetical protein
LASVLLKEEKTHLDYFFFLMAEDLDVAVAVVWTLAILIGIAIIALVYLWWNRLWIFAEKESTTTTQRYVNTVDFSEQNNNNNTSMMQIQPNNNISLFGNAAVCHMKTVKSVPAPGSTFSNTPVTVSLLTTFLNDGDRNLAIQQPERFRLYFHCAYQKDPFAKPQFPHTSNQNGFARYMAPLDFTEIGRYTIHAYALLWKGPQVQAPPLPPANPSAQTLAQYATKMEFFVGVEPRSFDGLRIDIDDQLDFPFGGADGPQSSESLLEMQRILAKHFNPPPGTYVAPLDVTVSSALSERYVTNISPQHLVTTDVNQQQFTLSLTGNHIVKLTSRNQRLSRSIEMAGVYVILPPPPLIEPNEGSITEITAVSIKGQLCCINDVNLKHYYMIDNNYRSDRVEQQPSLLYNVPFVIPCGEGSSEKKCRIIAQTIGRDGTQSDFAVANLKIVSTSGSVFMPNIKSPVCLVSALEPRLILQFNHGQLTQSTTASQADFGSQAHFDSATQNAIPSDVVFYYRVLKDEKKRGQFLEHENDDGTNEDFKIYNPAAAIPINESHCRIEAYAEKITGGRSERSVVAHYSWSESMLDSAHGFGTQQQHQSGRKNSRSAVASATTSARSFGLDENANKTTKTSVWHQQQMEQNRGNLSLVTGGANTLRPPIMSIVCSGATISFDVPPYKDYTIRYTLDGTSLDEDYREFQHGTEVDVSEYLKAFGRIQVKAAYYKVVTGPAGNVQTTYGQLFSRDFTMPFFSAAPGY